MTHPDVPKIQPAELKGIVDRHKLDGAIVIAVGPTHYNVVSWARDREQCKRFRQMVNDLCGLIDTEELSLG